MSEAIPMSEAVEFTRRIAPDMRVRSAVRRTEVVRVEEAHVGCTVHLRSGEAFGAVEGYEEMVSRCFGPAQAESDPGSPWPESTEGRWVVPKVSVTS